MALAPFTGERAVKEILLVKALPLRVVLLYRTAGWNARLFRKSLCKRLCKSLKTLSSAGGRPFRRSSGAAGGGESGPPRAGDIRHDMAWECRRPAARGLPGSPGGDKRGQDTNGFLSPLDSPYLPLRRDALRLRGETGVRGLGSVRRFAYGTLLCPEVSLRNLPRITVRGHPVQGANAVAAKSPASIKGVLLEQQTPLWAPRI